ncbi:MAG: PAS domain S-box protein [Nitrospinae bacterium]|nr:PAS domain S-box protein [Nitrospinota bacterium]
MSDKNSSGPKQIALVYLVVGSAWIVLSDRIMDILSLSQPQISFYQSVKGVGFMAVTSVIIYYMTTIWFGRIMALKCEAEFSGRFASLLGSINAIVARAPGEKELVSQCVTAILDSGEFPKAWIGLCPENDESKITIVARKGFTEGYLPDFFTIESAVEEAGVALSQAAVKTRAPAFSRDNDSLPPMDPNGPDNLSVVAVPLQNDGQVMGVLVIYCYRKEAFGRAEMEFLEELSSNLAYGVAAIRAREAKKRAVEELATALAQKRTVLDNAVVGVSFIVDRKLIWANQKCKELFGYSGEEMVDGFSTSLSYTSEEDFQKTGEAISRSFAQGKPYLVETPMRRRDGSFFTCRLFGKPVDYADPSKGAIWVLEDVTDRKKAQDELLENKEKYRTLIDMIPHGIVESGLDGSITFANKAFVDLLGAPREKVVGSKVWDIYGDKTERNANRVFHEMLILQRPLPSRYDIKINRQDRPPKNAQVDWCYRKDKDGQVAGIISVITDVTERKAAETMAWENEERFRQLSGASFEGILVHDNGTILMANETLALMAGYRIEETIGKNVLDFVAPESRAAVSAQIRERLDTPYEITILRKGGGTFLAEVTSRNVMWEGKPARVAAIRDISERKKGDEERARLAKGIEQSAEMVVITDETGVILYVNPAFERVTGFSKDEAMGKKPSIVKSGLHDNSFYHNMWARLASANVWSGRIVNRRKNGDLFEVDSTISPTLGADGNVINYVAVQRDITREAMLTRAREYFTSITSHEMRTPLAKLELARILLRKAAEGEEEGKFAQTMDVLEESFHNFHRIVSMTELISKLIVGGLEPARNPVYLYSAAQSCVESAEDMSRMEKRNVIIKASLENLPAETMIYGDMEMMRMAIMEIISNAIKYTPDGKNIYITGRVLPRLAILDIKDEGLGISRERLEHVFEPYFALEDPLRHSTGMYKYKGGGIGLGLTVARMIMERLGGRLSISSSGEHRGTQVTLMFPLNA